jgi:hexosaminidase
VVLSRTFQTVVLLPILLAPAISLTAATETTPDLMPLPTSLVQKQGRLAIDANFRIELPINADDRLREAAQRFLGQLSQQTAIPLESLRSTSGQVMLKIVCAGPGPAIESIDEDESYTLNVSSTGAELSAQTDVGVLRGLETVLQLVNQDRSGFFIPAVHVEDRPRFAWRGLLLDVTSHWMPLDVIKRNLDAMSAVKLNVFHWHLSDDQGFRVESKRYPKLHEFGSDGNYYTQEQVREVIAYAHARGIRIVPEFDMPGHCASWLVGYPELAAAPGPYSIIHTFGVYDPTLDPTREDVYRFIDGLLDEMTALFPDDYFHIGGDEVNGKQWHGNAKIQEYIHGHNLQDEHGLQTYFNQRLEVLVRKHGKKMVGWDEILHPDLPHDILIQSWRDQQSLATAAKQGHPAILSFGYYLDHLDRTEYHYSVDPQGGPSKDLASDARNRILGGEACMWTEFVSTETVDSRIWPKTAAIAERLWSAPNVEDVASMYNRVTRISQRLDSRGVTHRNSYNPMLERLAAGSPITDLRVLLDAVEPLGIDVRERARRYSQATPFNRVVDTARGESLPLRQLELEIHRLGESAPSSGDWSHVKRVLESWKENDQRLSPLIRERFLLLEAAPLSRDLAEAGAIGLSALQFIQSGHLAPAIGWDSRHAGWSLCSSRRRRLPWPLPVLPACW